MKQDEVADHLLRALYKHGGLTNFGPLLAPLGITDRVVIRRVGKDLKAQDLLEEFVNTTEGCGGQISASAIRIIEQLGEGDSIMGHIHGPRPAGTTNNYHFGNVDRSNLALNSEGSKQTIESPKDGVWETIVGWAKKAAAYFTRVRA